MKRNPLKEGTLTENSVGLGSVTPKMVRGRAEELAIINGDWLHDVSPGELKQARRELTGDADIDPQGDLLDSAPESERWDPVPGSTGHKAPVAPSEDEDDEGLSDNARLVEEGVAGAEHDQMVQAARAAARADGREG